jgi:CRP-like cAMP-binding protein
LLNHIDALCFSHTIQKGKLLLKAGDICHHLYFVRKGVFRGFVKEGSKEITTWITAENEIIASIRGIEHQLPSIENIQAYRR